MKSQQPQIRVEIEEEKKQHHHENNSNQYSFQSQFNRELEGDPEMFM
jgi:hypothetical protein